MEIVCFASFAHNIKGRVLDRKHEVEDIDKECIFFVNHCLPQPGCWGGFESLKAISSVFKINIMIFCENGHYYFADRFNEDYNKSVFIAFRDASGKTQTDTNRNHYDSVSNIDINVLSECSKYCAHTLVKTECKINSDSIISLNDSFSS